MIENKNFDRGIVPWSFLYGHIGGNHFDVMSKTLTYLNK